MIQQPTILRREHEIPPMVCCECGKEFQHKRRCIFEARKAGWLMCSTTVSVKQLDGTHRDEFIGECPTCQRGARDDG